MNKVPRACLTSTTISDSSPVKAPCLSAELETPRCTEDRAGEVADPREMDDSPAATAPPAPGDTHGSSTDFDLSRFSVPIRGSRTGKMWYPYLKVKSDYGTPEQYIERSFVVIGALKQAVDQDRKLHRLSEKIKYDCHMVGTSFEKAEPSIIVTVFVANRINHLRRLFRTSVTDALYCYSGSDISRLLKDPGEPAQPIFRLVYQQGWMNRNATNDSAVPPLREHPWEPGQPAIRSEYQQGSMDKNVSDVATEVLPRFPGTFCGAIIRHQSQHATVTLSLDVDGIPYLLSVGHIFSPTHQNLPAGNDDIDEDEDDLDEDLDDGNEYDDSDMDSDENEYDEYDDRQSIRPVGEREAADASAPLPFGSASPEKHHAHRVDMPAPNRHSQPDLDFAIVQIDTPTEVPEYANLFYSSGTAEPSSPIETVASSPRSLGAGVYVVSGANGLRRGRIIDRFSYLGSCPGKQMCRGWTVILDSGDGK